MELNKLLAEMFAALGSSNRMRIVDFLRDGERCQCELPDELQLEQSNISRHVKILISAGILKSRKDGTKTMLRIAEPALNAIIDDSRAIIVAQLSRQIDALKL
jgi:DNA-binding transcriptional ArsR family regulator